MAKSESSSKSAKKPGDLFGMLIDKRYSLEECLSEGTATTGPSTWFGIDNVLARPVVLRLAQGTRAGSRLYDAAARVGAIRHPVLAPILDTVSSTTPALRGVVREWVDARPLPDLLAEASPPPGRSVTLMLRIAEALETLHRQDLEHGNLVPSNIFVRADGRVALTDAGMHVQRAARSPDAVSGAIESDLDGFADVLHLCLSGTWPGDPDRCPDMAITPRDGAHPCAPRQVRAGVPRDLDAIWSRIVYRSRASTVTALRSAAEIRAALALLPSAPLGVDAPDGLAAPVESRPRGGIWGSRLRRSAPWLALALVGSVAWLLGIAVGTLPGQGGHAGPVTIASPGASPQPEAKPVVIRDFDPPPGDGHENAAAVPLSHDGDVSTAWTTDIYQGSPRLGGIKAGVGLLVDLGSPVAIKSVTLALPLAGASVEIRAGSSPSTAVAAYAVTASQADAKTLVTLHPDDPTPHRYWLIWLTSLPKVGGGYQGGIAEFAFVR